MGETTSYTPPKVWTWDAPSWGHFTGRSRPELPTTQEDTMYYRVVRQCTQSLKNLETWLDKAEQHAAAKNFDISVVLNDRLAPEQKPFIYQVPSACDYIKAAAAWLSGQTPPKQEDNEQTIDEVRVRIRKTVAF